ncbi:MAG: hypothetical protein ACI4TB_01190 [Lachnospiraceae bacterium]
MKKKIVMVMLCMVMALSATACGMETVLSGQTETEESDKDRDDKDDDKDEDKDETKTEDKDETKEDEKDVEPEKPVSGVVLGGEFEQDYDGFEYLYCETLMTESKENETTGKMESQSLNVFIPIGDYSSVNRDTAYSDKMGVEFRVTLNPYIRYDEDDYLPEENMQYYLDYEYDEFYCTNYKNVTLSEVEEAGDGVRACASYFYYDKWDDAYIPVYTTYFLRELSKDMEVLVEVEIHGDSTTGKTDALIAELEEFYGFDIAWDAKKAESDLEAFLATGVSDTQTVSTGYLLFELPMGWEQDYNYGDYSNYAYAPDGDASSAGCVISITREYMGMDSFDVSEFLKNEEETKEYLAETLGETASNIEIEDYGTTCLGNAVKVSFETKDGSYEDMNNVYFISNDDYVYTVVATAVSGCPEDVFTMTEEILANGKVKE